MARTKLGKLITGVASTAVPAALGAGVVAVDHLEAPSRYSTDYAITRSIDELIAPSAAQLVGQYTALDELGASFSKEQLDVRDELSARYDSIRAADHKGGLFDQLNAYTVLGHKTGMTGYLSADEVTEHASTVLQADRDLHLYAQQTISALESVGLKPDLAQTVTAGMIGTELLSTDFEKQITPEGFIADAPFSAEVKDHLTTSLPDLWAPFDAVHHAGNMSFLTVQDRSADAMQALSRTRPVSRPEDLDRSARIEARARALATPDERTARIQDRARTLASSRRPVARPERAAGSAEI